MDIAKLTRVGFGPRPADAMLLLFISLGLNIVANWLAPHLNGLLYLDMIGTALAAIALGPWWGAVVALCTNALLPSFRYHDEYFRYAIVNVLGGMLWGFAARHPRLALFRVAISARQLFVRLVLLGIIGGCVCSLSATYTRFNFLSRVNGADLKALLSQHPVQASELLVQIMEKERFFQSGDYTIKFLLLDVYAMIPDKLLSIALGSFVFFYFFPKLRHSEGGGNQQISSRSSAAIFLLLYTGPLLFVCFRGFHNLKGVPEVLPKQAALWCLPGVMALLSLFWPHRATPQEAVRSAIENSVDQLPVDEVYKDLMGFVVLWYTLLLIFAPPYKTPLIEQLVRFAIGTFAVFLYLPWTVKRYWAPGSPEAVIFLGPGEGK
jgi:hypothetical protein